MNNKGKSKNKAVLTTMVNKNLLNFATKRLLKDLDEIENNKIPTVGVTARPLEKDLFVWHANIRGPEKTLYEGGVFHLELKIPELYPQSPPTITIFQTLPHPNVFGQTVCLDMLQTDRSEGLGWTPAYTIQSVLLQLQSFLFEASYEEKDNEKKIKKAVNDSNSFKCKVCKHGGKLAAWPQFNVKEADNDCFKIFESEKDLFYKELVCFYTKLSVEKSNLGIGLSVTRVPRSGDIRQASVCMDYISLRAFIKEGIRNAVDNEKFFHWIPLHFGLDIAPTLHLGKRAISMVYANSTKRFKAEMIIDLFPKMLLTVSALIMDEKRHCSIRMLRLFGHIHCLFLLFLETYPDLYKEIEKRLSNFTSNEKQRHKDQTPNLGVLLIYSLVAPNAKLIDILPTYFDEQLDRQVFWLLKSIPDLEDESTDTDLNRVNVSFKLESTSYQILSFFSMIIKKFKNAAKTNKDLLKMYEGNYGKMADSFENDIQKETFNILKIDNYDTFFGYIGMKKLSQKEILLKLRTALGNSKAKKYHGTDDEILTLPSNEEQIKNLFKDLPQLQHFIIEGKLKELSEKEWRENCIKRWGFIKEMVDWCPSNLKISPEDVLIIAKRNIKEGYEKPENRLAIMKNNFLNPSARKELASTLDLVERDFTWKELFIKLDLEDHLFFMDLNPDFHVFYDKIKSCNKFIKSLIIPILPIKNLKSNYHFITSLLTNLVHLKNLELIGPNYVELPQISLKAITSLSKGLHNFKKNGGVLHRLQYYNIGGTSGDFNICSDRIFSPLMEMLDLKSLNYERSNLLQYKGGTLVGKFITIQRDLEVLNLSKSNLNLNQSKELADGIMRAKQIKRIDLSLNPNITLTGISTIIYNLAFSPKLQYLNISGSLLGVKSDIESLYKLLRISGSLEILDISNCPDINAYFSKDFFKSLGEIKTLRKVDLSYSGFFNSSGIVNLGNAIAFNAKKHGSLEEIKMKKTLNYSSYLGSLYQSMCISEKDHEEWYGDINKASKMKGTELAKTYYNNLRVLDFSFCPNLKTGFSLANFKKKYDPQDPDLVKLLARSSKLENVQLESVGLEKNDADLLLLSLDPTRKQFCSKIKILNLSKNSLGKEGCKDLSEIFLTNNILEVLDISNNKMGVSGAQSFAKALENNKSLKVLNLFSNNIDVDGARAFEKTFEKNNTLEWVDFGHNRLRDEGCLAIARGINANKKSVIKCLGLKFNFITDDGVCDFFKKLYSDNNKPALEDIFLKNNSIQEYGIYQIKALYDQMNIKVHMDIFDTLKFNSDASRLERTIWIFPVLSTPNEMKNFLENEQKCGIIVNIRKRKGPKWPNRATFNNEFYLVEFAQATSVTRALHVASRKKAVINGTGFRIYKAGSGTFFYTKKARGLNTKTNLLKGRNPMARGVRGGRVDNLGRGRGARFRSGPIARGRGRGRGRG